MLRIERDLLLVLTSLATDLAGSDRPESSADLAAEMALLERLDTARDAAILEPEAPPEAWELPVTLSRLQLAALIRFGRAKLGGDALPPDGDRQRIHFEAVNYAIDTGRAELAALRRGDVRSSARERALREGLRVLERYAAERWIAPGPAEPWPPSETMQLLVDAPEEHGGPYVASLSDIRRALGGTANANALLLVASEDELRESHAREARAKAVARELEAQLYGWRDRALAAERALAERAST